MFAEQRQDAVLNVLASRGTISVDEAADVCGVSVDTARRDFNKLASKGLAVRTHGGLMSAAGYAFDRPLVDRVVERSEQKALIAAAAARFVGPDDTIALDAGTTVFGMVGHLADKRNLTVITYSLDIASAIGSTDTITTILLGGMVRNHTRTLVGPDTVAMVKRFHANTLFLAANGVSVGLGLMTVNRMEAEIKTALMAIADRVVLMVDSTKINKRALVTFGQLDMVQCIVTDSEVDRQFAAAVERAGCELVLVGTTGDKNVPSTRAGNHLPSPVRTP